jgi:hypothetical protein
MNRAIPILLAALASTPVAALDRGPPAQRMGPLQVRTSGSLLRALDVAQTPSGSNAGSVSLNKLMINGGAVNTGPGGSSFGFVEGLTVAQHFGGTGWSGGVNGLSVYAFRDAATPANNNNGNYVAITGTSEAVTTDGGTASNSAVYGGTTGLLWQSGAKGAHFGGNFQAGLQEDATNIFNVTGAEFNVYSRLATVQLTTTSGSTAASYTSAAGKIGFGQVVVASGVPVGTTVTAVTPGANGSGSVTLSVAATASGTGAAQMRPSVYYKSGVQITNRADDVVKGSVIDTLVSLSGQGSTKFNYGILIGSQNGAAPVEPTGTLIGTYGTGTIANGFDLSSYTVTGSLLKGQNTNLFDGILALSALNSGMEIGSLSQSGLGLIDGHSSGFNNDYDARIQFYGGSSTNGRGKISFVGGGVVFPTATPASSSAQCDQGQIQSDANYIYVCVSANTWKRSALSGF